MLIHQKIQDVIITWGFLSYLEFFEFIIIKWYTYFLNIILVLIHSEKLILESNLELRNSSLSSWQGDYKYWSILVARYLYNAHCYNTKKNH